MSKPSYQLSEIPAETARVVRKISPKGNMATRLRDELEKLYEDEEFAQRYPITDQPGYASWRLVLVTILQYEENLTDRQAANAVCARLDWKYCLGLPLEDPGFDFSLLAEFRTRLVDGQAETLLLEQLLEVCKARGWLKTNSKPQIDTTHVLARIRSLCDLERMGITILAALDELTEIAPDWLFQQVNLDWFDRYGLLTEDSRLPKAESQRKALAQRIGADGQRLLQALTAPSAPGGLHQLASVQALRAIWQQQYEHSGGNS